MAKNRQINNDSLVLFSVDELVPQDHLLRDLDEFTDWNFIYDICDPLYSDIGTNRIDPVVLFKLIMINIIFGYHSIRGTCEEAKINIKGMNIKKFVKHKARVRITMPKKIKQKPN